MDFHGRFHGVLISSCSQCGDHGSDGFLSILSLSLKPGACYSAVRVLKSLGDVLQKPEIPSTFHSPALKINWWLKNSSAMPVGQTCFVIKQWMKRSGDGNAEYKQEYHLSASHLCISVLICTSLLLVQKKPRPLFLSLAIIKHCYYTLYFTRSFIFQLLICRK